MLKQLNVLRWRGGTPKRNHEWGWTNGFAFPPPPFMKTVFILMTKNKKDTTPTADATTTPAKRLALLVTGATGFIGNYVVEALLQKGFSVMATSSNEEKARQYSWFPSVTYIPFDIKNFSAATDYFSFFEKPDAVIHLAWEGLPNYKNEFHITENLPRHLQFIKNLIEHGLKDITITGTCFEYGMQEGKLAETLVAMPGNAYAQAKNELRKHVEELQSSYDFSFKWLRLFYTWGKGQNPNSLIPQLEAAITKGDTVFNMSGGEQVRDFLPVEKVAAYIVKAATQTKMDGVINICSGQPITVKKFITNYLQQQNKQIELNLGFYPYPDFEPMQFWGCTEKLKKII